MGLLRKFRKWRTVKIARKDNRLSDMIHSLRYEVIGSDNVVSVDKDNNQKQLLRVSISIKGTGNSISIGKNIRVGRGLQIHVRGHDNKVIIGDSIEVVDNLSIGILKSCCNGVVSIGDGTTFWKTSLKNYDTASLLSIGKDCMFSYDTSIVNTDEHAVLNDGSVVNRGQRLELSDHVWVGWGASVLKNTTVSKNSIIGRGAIVSGKFEEEGSVLVGVPARVVRKGISWSRKSVNDFEQ